MKKFVSDEELYYEDFKKDMQSYWGTINKHGFFRDAKTFETGYLYQNVDFQHDEHDRLCVVLPLIKLEIEKNILTETMLEELEIYYADFNDGVFDDVIYEHEYEEIKSDLYWCYKNK